MIRELSRSDKGVSFMTAYTLDQFPNEPITVYTPGEGWSEPEVFDQSNDESFEILDHATEPLF